MIKILHEKMSNAIYSNLTRNITKPLSLMNRKNEKLIKNTFFSKIIQNIGQLL